MNYKDQIKAISNYFRINEKKKEDFRIGLELEHFIIDLDSFKTISYYGEDGVADRLKGMERLGYQGVYEGDYILGLNKDKKHVTLEPGSQVELSIDASQHIWQLEKEYFEFLEDIIPLLSKKGQGLLTSGYHPVSKIDEIKLLPKQRYDYMFNYFKTRGSHAHNMMKGTSALQVSLDYQSEEDYIRKFQVANALSPVFYSLFENAYYFEGEATDMHNIRAHIWDNCDSHRSGLVEGALDKDFSYEKYAQYILDRPAIFINRNGREIFTGARPIREIYDPESFSQEELEHLLTMFFPDVRTKKFIEIRMMDSIPHPLNFSAIALLVGLFYNEDNLNELYEYIQDIGIEDVDRARDQMKAEGLRASLKGRTLLDIGTYLLELARRGLGQEDQKYLDPLAILLEDGKSPYDIVKAKAGQGKKAALDWCLLNRIMEE